MHRFVSLITILQTSLTAAGPQPQDGTTTCWPTMWPSTPSVTATDALSASPTSLPMKALSVCCCCIAVPPYTFDEPQPNSGHYISKCSKVGSRDAYTGVLGYAMGGLEGQPDKIAAQCSTVRCGAILFVD
ncbi:hypothetical protein F5Y19DRAFT_227456 [Xylariaceae sp. FL1651]|nr:hypothetical protein F5Y19DRAFT_227456 [Xylariaceae sp. FL1651]